MKSTKLFILGLLVALSGSISANAATLIDYGDVWNYKEINPSLVRTNWSTFTYDSVFGDLTGYSQGSGDSNGVFHWYTAPYSGGTIALWKDIDLSSDLLSAYISVSVDDRTTVFVNGIKAAQSNQYSGYTPFGYTGNIDESLFQSGINRIAIIGDDNIGWANSIAIQLTGEFVSTPVPEPSSLILGLLGLSGALGLKKKKSV